MTLLLATFGVALASAWIPIIPIEGYLAGAVTQTSLSPLLLAGSATVGQMAGKVAIFLLGRQSMQWPWLRKQLARHKAERWVERLTTALNRRPFAADGIVLGSAFIGIPPFAVVSVLAGQLRVQLARFVLWGTVGRFARFAAVALGVEQVLSVI
ncbi:MAG: VTT domain-containing protein [Nocardioidaceae bacterium]|nr:VTT domain-containing protein [Nocardioidaceae bacterium]